MLLSVIVPFYHVEGYIEACLSRAAQLDAGECEVLLVDDCGTDGSSAIAERFAREYANFRVIRREKNGGLSAARNTGLAQARGEYVYFLDSDDLPQPQELYALACSAHERELDVAKARFVYFDDLTGRETPGPAICAGETAAGGELFAAQCDAGLYEPMVWQCVYRRAFLEENALRMAEGLLFEDELFQAPALLKAARAAAFEQVILRYRQREGSIMASFARSSRWCQSYLEVCRSLDALAKTLPSGAPRTALMRRMGQIALGTAKNISAYGLKGAVEAEARAFVKAHGAELSGYAMRSGNSFVAAQGILLRLSLPLFLKLYARAA